MIISIASGKGGTGKTTVDTNLAYSISIAQTEVKQRFQHQLYL